jgi:hypothetical protein
MLVETKENVRVDYSLLGRIISARREYTTKELLDIAVRNKSKAMLNRTVAYRVTNYY